jgi:hypothetical protein
MKTNKKTDLETRDSILKLLSDDEVAKVSTAEAALQLAEGDEYLDLDQLDHGIQHVDGIVTPLRQVLPKKAAHPATWNKILAKLSAPVTPS